MGNDIARYFVLIIIELALFAGSFGADLDAITPWLLGINFSIALFSINFTFFGYQLSKYKAIYSAVTKRQRINITVLLALPILPLVIFLWFPSMFGLIALLVLPILVFSAFDNADLTSSYLSPRDLIEKKLSEKPISRYLEALSIEVAKDAKEHEEYLKNREKFQIPSHAHDFEPGVLGIEVDDLWDLISILVRVSIDNYDYPVFKKSINAAIKLSFAAYAFSKETDLEGKFNLQSGIKFITRNRLHSVIVGIADNDERGVFLQSLSSELCDYLTKDETLQDPCSDISRLISHDAVWIGKKALELRLATEPLKVLNTIHRVAELSIYRLAGENQECVTTDMAMYNISAYVYDIKALGVTALSSGNSYFAYRCMETLSYLGCNAAKRKSKQAVVSVFESIVQIGRVAKSLKIGCFWSRCLIPAESHAEEFMGHILTWLVQDCSIDGRFYMREYAEQAYSRLRGTKCIIEPKSNLNPKFWIEELKEDGRSIAHIERESGMYGYDGEMDYSDLSNLKDYVLHGIGSASDVRIFHTPPMPMTIVDDESK